jgi:nucleotide-binding universal stress UspA family protein
MIKGGYAKEATVLNIVKIDIPWADAYNQKFDIKQLREHAFKLAGRYLDQVEMRLADRQIRVRTEALEANRPAEAITDYARDNGMDLIVMATHGRTGMTRLMLGSVAQSVLHQSSVPVLLVRPESCYPDLS